MKDLIIFGTGDIAELAKYYFEQDSDTRVVAFTVDREFIIEDSFHNLPVIPFDEIAQKYPSKHFDMFIALSYTRMNRLREEKFYEAIGLGYKLVSYISSNVSNYSSHGFGQNCFILEDNTIQPYVKIGDNVTLWSGNHIGHHSVIKSHNFVSSHVVISGHCQVRSNCFIGVNATIGHNVTLDSGTLVGAGAIITKSTEANGVYVPSKSIKLERPSNSFKL
ncbi:MAG: acetyltransferase [Flavobacteriales bacterium]|nr:acetyltransferase [Flavobacteriales bacterium]